MSTNNDPLVCPKFEITYHQAIHGHLINNKRDTINYIADIKGINLGSFHAALTNFQATWV